MTKPKIKAVTKEGDVMACIRKLEVAGFDLDDEREMVRLEKTANLLRRLNGIGLSN